MRGIVLIAHNLRSTHNVGSILRTADGLGIAKVYLTGYTPHPVMPNDERLPYLAQKIHKQISKTALGAEESVSLVRVADILEAFAELREQGFTIAALEQTKTSIKLPDYKPPEKIALVLGREVEGIEPEVVEACDVVLEIPMVGQKESFNVSVAAGMAAYHLRFG